MKKYFIPLILLAVLAVPLVGKASVISDLEAMLATLVSQVQSLKDDQGAAVTSATMPPAPCVLLTRNLMSGMKDKNTNGEVTLLQNFLIAQRSLKVVANGIYGPATVKAVIAFQKANGLEQTGTVGPLTRAKINAINCATPTGPLTVTAPNNGEKWQIGSTHTIKWTPYDPKIGVNVALSDVNAYLMKSIGNGEFAQVGKIVEPCGKASIHWDGSLDSFCGGKLAEPGDYYIKLVNSKTGESDMSDKSFTLLPANYLKTDLKVNGSDSPFTIPAGGANYTISWESNAEKCQLINNNNPSDPNTNLSDLHFSGSKVVRLEPNPNGFDSSLYMICSSSSSLEGNSSDYILMLADTNAPSIKITTPNGGETLALDSDIFVKWDTKAILSKVSIGIYKNDASYKWIIKDLPIPQNPTLTGYGIKLSSVLSASDVGDDYKVYVIGYLPDGKTVEDKSDAPFKVVSSSSSPTASLTANGLKDITVKVGDTITYKWSSTNADQFSSTYVALPTPGGPTNCGSGTWVANSASGTHTTSTPAGQAGCTYYITYTAKNSQITPPTIPLPVTGGQDTVIVRVLSSSADPVATLTANGSSDTLNLKVGDKIVYKWAAKNADTFSSSYLSMPGTPAACTSGGPWIANNGGDGYIVDATPSWQAGCDYIVTYVAKNSKTGAEARDTINVKVAPAASPAALLTVNGAHDATVSVGDSITYKWSSTNTGTFSSTVYTDQPFSKCLGAASAPWVANNGGQTLTVTIADWQAGCSYDVFYYATDSATGVVSQDKIRIKMIGAPAVLGASTSKKSALTATIIDGMVSLLAKIKQELK